MSNSVTTEYCWWRQEDRDEDPFFAFYGLDVAGTLALRDSYRAFACSVCRKLDHFRAITVAGLEPFTPHPHIDFQHTADGLACVSKRLWAVLSKFGGQLPRMFPIPRNDTHVVVWPVQLAHVDVDRSTVRFHRGPCERCGLHLDVTCSPDSFLGVSPPVEASNVFALDVQPQGRNWRSMELYMRKDLCDIMKQHKPTGVSFRRCGQHPAILLKE